MDAKDLRTATALSERNDDGNKYAQSGTIQCNKYKPYRDIGSNSSVKVDTPNSRPCAVIGPDRVLPQSDLSEAYFKKASVEPWPLPDNTYHGPSEYVQKITSYQNPARNISPRQTFQENMQRVMVAPTYNTAKINDETTYLQLPDRNIPQTSSSKMSISADSKYCDVPYTVIPTNNDSKSIRNAEICMPNVNPNDSRSAPHGWPPGTMNVHPQRPYASSEVYSSYPDYPSCAGPRHVPIPRPHRAIPEEPGCMYPEPYYNESNIRFKPYPNLKEKYQQPRYEYINNYSNPFHPPPFLPHKYDLQKPLPPHPYSGYPHFKYIDSRVSEPSLDGFQRPVNQPSNYSVQYRNHVIHPTYGPMLANCSQGKLPPYSPDSSNKQIPSNKLPYDNNKMYVNYENVRLKPFTQAPDNFYINETSRIHPMKSQGIMPNFSPLMHTIPHPYYKKENSLLKTYEYANHYKNIKPSINMSPGSRYIPQFSPNTLAISPTDSTASNDTMKTQGQEDCGYVSQSSTTSVRSMDSGIQRINDYYGRFDYRYSPVIRTSPISTKSSVNIDVKEKKDIDVRQFLQMWSEGDEENIESRSNKESAQRKTLDINYLSKQHETMMNQEQLYVLGSVNVPSEELGKYQHIQRVSKLPENIKGYTNIELLNQFEEVIGSSNIHSTKKIQNSSKGVTGKQTIVMGPRPVSPLDVEAKISQSIIHKEVGCNFEIKPCSPKMLNVEIAAPVHNILTERTIEKVTNRLPTVLNSSMLSGVEENTNECKVSKRQNNTLNETKEISSCKMKNLHFSTNNINSMKNNYSVQDLESNMGVCLASLPRLDNDIELNFPEVNQQFINANKVEPIISTSVRDLPDLDVLDESNNNLHIETLTTESKIIEEYPNKLTTEKEFKKLSQYRKTKLCDSESKAVNLSPVLLRTDSVIIKNPENTKTFNTCIGEDQETPINLTSQNEVKSVSELLSHENKTFDKEKNENCLISNTAVDFILYKSNSKYFSSDDYKSESQSLKNLSPQKDIKEDSSSRNPSLLSHCQDNELIGSNNASFTYTIVSETNKSKSIFDFPSKELSVTYNPDTNIENNKQSQSISESIETQISISDHLEDKITNYDIINGICTSEVESDICELQKDHMVINKTEEQTSSNCLIDETIQENSISEVVEGGKILLGVQESLMTLNKENDHSNQSPSLNIDIDETKNETTPPSVIFHNKSKENDILDPESEVNNDVLMNYNDDNTINSETEFKQEDNQNHVQSNFQSISSIQEKPLAVCNESETVSDTKLQTELLLSEKSCNDDNFNKICQENNNEILLSEIKKPARRNGDFPSSVLENVKSEFQPYNSYICADVKTNYKNKVGRVSKKLYSPWIRKLLIHNEGPCISISLSNEISAVNEVIENQNLQNAINANCVDTKEINIIKNIDNVFHNNSCCVSTDLNSKEHKININTLVDGVCDNIHVVAKDVDDNLSNTISNTPRSDEIISLKECLDINIKQLETVSTNSTKSENETSLESEPDTQDPLSLKPTELVHTSLNFDETIRNQNENDCEMKQDESTNNVKSDNSHVIESYLSNKPHFSLKRSLSDSAINQLHNDFQDEQGDFRNTSLKWQYKRKKTNYIENTNDSNLIAQKLCNMLQNRRNSISSIYNNENVSFCILIDDNCIITEEDEGVDKICFTEYSEDCLEIPNALVTEEEATVIEGEEIACLEEKSCDYSESFMLDCNQEKSLGDSWVQDVACVETVVSDDIAEDIVISALSSPKNYDLSDHEESGIYSSDLSDHTEKVKYIYGEKMCSDDAHFVETLYKTPQMDVNKTLITREPHIFQPCNKFYDTESLEKILSESNSHSGLSAIIENTDSIFSSNALICHKTPDNKENISSILSPLQTIQNDKTTEPSAVNTKTFEITQDDTVHSCKSSNDNIFSYKHEDETINYTTYRSPEVSSTTTEEKNSSILLKITNYKGSITSQINQININSNRPCCKFTEKSDYIHSNGTLNSTRPLITKAAQKYIPPLKESIRDLKVKLPLPQKSLLKLKQLKLSKDKPKVHNNYNKNIPPISKKPKPKFEDVLKSIDEIQFKKHKEKNKKSKNAIPKVVIKKNENGSHYASTSNQDTYNPDLTGRKWQPWVFLEKNNFVDKMAIKNKNKAVFNYRKNTYVLAEKFYKYKSVTSTKFFITQQKLNASSTGQLKYTIRLKHNY